MSFKLAKVAAVGLGLMSIGAAPARAGGVIGDLVEGVCGQCGAGKALDKANKDLGNPVDHAVTATVGTAVGVATGNPAVGTAVTLGLEANQKH